MTQPAVPARKSKQPRHAQPPHTPQQPHRGQNGQSSQNSQNRHVSPPAAAGSRPAPAAFADLPLPRPLVEELASQGVTTAFPIQAAALPDALAGRDVLGCAGTGSGKTLAFGLALLARIAGQRAKPHQPLALVLAPTRELAQQIRDALLPYGRTLGPRLTTAVGGAPIQRQIDALRRGSEVLVATPGRLADLVRRGACTLDHVRISVVDEADQMADMGFLPEVSALLDQVAPNGQRMLFSATLDGEVDALIRGYLTEPVAHSVDPPAATIATMTHHLLRVDVGDKQRVMAEIAARDGRTLVFVRTKDGADQLAHYLFQEGVQASALHSGKSQAVRTRTLERFRHGRVSVLVATDVAARGIHVDRIGLVVNADPPQSAKDYLHRGGRTARAGESGAVTTLVLPKQRRMVQRMMDVAGVNPESALVRPGDTELARITGARTPPGTPASPLERAPATRNKPAAKPNPGGRSGRSRPEHKHTGRPKGTETSRRQKPARGGGARPERPRS